MTARRKRVRRTELPADVHAVPAVCPECGDVHDCQSNASPDDTRPPVPGDFTVCLNCGEVMVFDDALRPRRSTLEERSEAPDMLMAAVKWIVERGRYRR